MTKCWPDRASALLLAALLALPVAASAGVLSRTELSNLDAAELSALDLRNGSGGVEIHGEDREDIRLEMTVKARHRSREKARELLDRAELELRREGPLLVLRPELPEGNVWMDLVLRVPARLDVSARTGSGDLHAEGLDGDALLAVGSGDLTAKRLGGAADIHGNSGTLRIKEVAGPLLVEGGSGNLSLRRAGADCQVKMDSGDAGIWGVKGDLRARLRSGDLAVRDLAGDAELETSSGDLELHGVAGSAELRSSSGDQSVSGVGWPGQDLVLIASSGDLDLRLRPEAAFELRLETASGDVEATLPLEVSQISRQRLRARLGDGSGRLRMETSSGDIRIRYMEERK